MVNRLGIQSAPHAAQDIRNLMIKIIPCYSCATGSSIFLSLRDYQRYGCLYAIQAVRGRLRRAALRLANSRHQRKRRLPAEFKGFGQRNFIKRKKEMRDPAINRPKYNKIAMIE
jgi:hypothetical protein